MLVVSRRKTERGTDTDEGEQGIMMQAAAAAIRVEAAEAAEAVEASE